MVIRFRFSFDKFMPHSQWGELVEFDMEIEKTLQKVCRVIKFKISTTEEELVIDKANKEVLPYPPPITATKMMEDYARPSVLGTQ